MWDLAETQRLRPPLFPLSSLLPFESCHGKFLVVNLYTIMVFLHTSVHMLSFADVFCVFSLLRSMYEQQLVGRGSGQVGHYEYHVEAQPKPETFINQVENINQKP